MFGLALGYVSPSAFYTFCIRTYACYPWSGAQGRINLYGQSMLRFGGASTIFYRKKLVTFFNRRCFNLYTLAP